MLVSDIGLEIVQSEIQSQILLEDAYIHTLLISTEESFGKTFKKAVFNIAARYEKLFNDILNFIIKTIIKIIQFVTKSGDQQLSEKVTDEMFDINKKIEISNLIHDGTTSLLLTNETILHTFQDFIDTTNTVTEALTELETVIQNLTGKERLEPDETIAVYDKAITDFDIKLFSASMFVNNGKSAFSGRINDNGNMFMKGAVDICKERLYGSAKFKPHGVKVQLHTMKGAKATISKAGVETLNERMNLCKTMIRDIHKGSTLNKIKSVMITLQATRDTELTAGQKFDRIQNLYRSMNIHVVLAANVLQSMYNVLLQYTMLHHNNCRVACNAALQGGS